MQSRGGGGASEVNLTSSGTLVVQVQEVMGSSKGSAWWCIEDNHWHNE